MENFKVTLNLTKLSNAKMMKDKAGNNLLVIYIDDCDGVETYVRDDGTKSVFLNLYARQPKVPREDSTHFLIPVGKSAKGERTQICGNVKPIRNRIGQPTDDASYFKDESASVPTKTLEDLTAEDLPF